MCSVKSRYAGFKCLKKKKKKTTFPLLTTSWVFIAGHHFVALLHSNTKKHGVPLFIGRRSQGRGTAPQLRQSTNTAKNEQPTGTLNFIFTFSGGCGFVLRKPWQRSINSHHAIHFGLSIAAANPCSFCSSWSKQTQSHPVFPHPAFHFQRDSRSAIGCYLL